ncbi:MAG: ThiF family adenylyltransferase [Chthoniobacteraceae bacterium]
MRHLLRSDRQEDICFALWNPSRGKGRETALIERLILPTDGDRRVHGNASFLPQYFERAIQIARSNDSGIALMHSHLGPGWQEMSDDDINAEKGNAPAVLGATDLPLVGLTAGTDGAWSARFWNRIGPRDYRRQWCESVRVVGDRLHTTFNDSLLARPQFGRQLTRTVSAWGRRNQEDVSRLRVGIIGAGSVGSIVAEILARMGIANLYVIDFDIVKHHNLDRLLHATLKDAQNKRLKSEVLTERLKVSATAPGFSAIPFNLSVVEEEGFRQALDCDVLFSCVDRPWARFVLNFIAYAHLIPVIDGGVMLSAMSNEAGLKRGTWRAHIAAPTRKCLECLGQYDPSDVSLERSGFLDDPAYIEGLPKDHRLRNGENVFPFCTSVASLEVNQFLRMVIPHPGRANIGAQIQHFTTGEIDLDATPCGPSCPFCGMIAKGDRSGYEGITGIDRAADKMRSEGQNHPEIDSSRGIARLFRKILSKWF